jgi:hypothetical protein
VCSCMAPAAPPPRAHALRCRHRYGLALAASPRAKRPPRQARGVAAAHALALPALQPQLRLAAAASGAAAHGSGGTRSCKAPPLAPTGTCTAMPMPNATPLLRCSWRRAALHPSRGGDSAAAAAGTLACVATSGLRRCPCQRCAPRGGRALRALRGLAWQNGRERCCCCAHAPAAERQLQSARVTAPPQQPRTEKMVGGAAPRARSRPWR